MPELPEAALQGFDSRRGPAVFATVDPDGRPNVIWVSCVWRLPGGRIVIVDNELSKTRANILAGSKGALLYASAEGASYQVKGHLEYHTGGALFDEMKRRFGPDLPGKAAVVIYVEETWQGSKRVTQGRGKPM